MRIPAEPSASTASAPIGSPYPGRCYSTMPTRPLPTETVEFPVADASQECLPLVWREPENRSFGVLAIADTDPAARQVGHLDAVAVGEAQRALDPVCS